jgi:ATP-dependent helicase HrpA
VTSATIDTARFSEHFGGAPVVEVSGRTYPVEVRYEPYGVDDGDDRDQVQAICDAVSSLSREAPGDILVFLSGEREIRDTADSLRGLSLRDTEILPLFARLSAAEQHRSSRAHGPARRPRDQRRRTSLRAGHPVHRRPNARISATRAAQVQRLPIRPSRRRRRTSAGRCGRVATACACASTPGRLPRARVHRAGDPAHQPASVTADDRARSRRHRQFRSSSHDSRR